jgi:hypothetical protein
MNIDKYEQYEYQYQGWQDNRLHEYSYCDYITVMQYLYTYYYKKHVFVIYQWSGQDPPDYSLLVCSLVVMWRWWAQTVYDQVRVHWGKMMRGKCKCLEIFASLWNCERWAMELCIISARYVWYVRVCVITWLVTQRCILTYKVRY